MSSQSLCTVSVESGTVTAASAVIGICHGQSGEWKLVSLTMVPQVALSADGSNKYVIAVTQGSDTVCTSLDSSSAAHVARTAQSFSVTGTAGDALEFGATDILKMTFTETGTASANVTFVAAFEKVRV